MAPTRLDEVFDQLRRAGPQTAATLGRALGVSQPTMSRLLAAGGERIVRIGRARASHYALARDIGRAGHRWPLHRIRADGATETLGVLSALHGGGMHLTAARPAPALLHGPFTDGLFPGLPWFLDDQRPQGFLGRAFARRVAASIGVPDDLNRWQTEDVLLALLRHGDDAPGDLVLGDDALARALQQRLAPTDAITIAERAQAYPARALAALLGEDAGSSAAGEQPKFTALLHTADEWCPVIVKFTDRADTPAARRWADLLRAEHRAGMVLAAHDISAASSDVLEAGGRVFLQSARFDRTAMQGRRGLVSLAALDAAFYGYGRTDWWTFAVTLARDGWLSHDDAVTLAVRGWFGALIGNSDMHLGNAGLLLADTRPFALAPSYDMLPMVLRPAVNGEVVARALPLPLPTPEQRAHWHAAATLASMFWRGVADDAAISVGVRDIAARQHDALAAAMRAQR